MHGDQTLCLPSGSQAQSSHPAAGMSGLPQSTVHEVRVRHWHIGCDVSPGPAFVPSFGPSEQLAHPNLVRAIIVAPDDQALLEWSSSCLSVLDHEGADQMGGWSPGRSVAVRVEIRGVGSDVFFYKLFDHNACDVELTPHCPTVVPPSTMWAPVWSRFLRMSATLQLQHLHRPDASDMLRDMVYDEVETWNGELCIDFSGAIGLPTDTPAAARDNLLRWSRHYIMSYYMERARALDSRVFQLRPGLALDFIVMSRWHF